MPLGTFGAGKNKARIKRALVFTLPSHGRHPCGLHPCSGTSGWLPAGLPCAVVTETLSSGGRALAVGDQPTLPWAFLLPAKFAGNGPGKDKARTQAGSLFVTFQHPAARFLAPDTFLASFLLAFHVSQ
jgi:hypothetical protein